MAWRYHGHARVSPSAPQAFAVCDRCKFLFNHVDLQWQQEWAGAGLQNLRLLVCKTCLDRPQEQLRAVVLPPDPRPIKNPRPENYTAEMANYIATQTPEPITIPPNDDNLITQPTGDDMLDFLHG